MIYKWILGYGEEFYELAGRIKEEYENATIGLTPNNYYIGSAFDRA